MGDLQNGDFSRFSEAGWGVRKQGLDCSRASASNGRMSIEFTNAHQGKFFLFLERRGSWYRADESLAYLVDAAGHEDEVATTLIDWLPRLTPRSFRKLIRDVVRTGSVVETEVRGEWMNVADE
ncbi:hypothetical protein [Mariniluteicoccus flavus]